MQVKSGRKSFIASDSHSDKPARIRSAIRMLLNCSARFQALSLLPEMDRVTLYKIDYRFPKERNRSEFGQ
jgi:hypothetical protein